MPHSLNGWGFLGAMKYEKNDKVVCIDDSPHNGIGVVVCSRLSELKRGVVYVVEGYNRDGNGLMLVGCENNWMDSRFRPLADIKRVKRKKSEFQ